MTDFRVFPGDDRGDDACGANGNRHPNVTDNPLKTNGGDDGDDGDDHIPQYSGNDPFATLRKPKYGLQPVEEDTDA
jgi:hypothetical protein